MRRREDPDKNPHTRYCMSANDPKGPNTEFKLDAASHQEGKTTDKFRLKTHAAQVLELAKPITNTVPILDREKRPYAPSS